MTDVTSTSPRGRDGTKLTKKGGKWASKAIEIAETRRDNIKVSNKGVPRQWTNS